jgi:succinate dehydrogenase/fumarate reductase flavoprotein subunit
MQPVIERYSADIQETKLLNEKTKNNIEALQKQLEDNMVKINTIKNKNIELSEEEEKLKEIQLKIKDSPDHYAKSA